MADTYAVKPAPRTVRADASPAAPRNLDGIVQGREVRQYVIDIQASADAYAVGDATEIIVNVNGRTWKRLTLGQAERAGLVTRSAY